MRILVIGLGCLAAAVLVVVADLPAVVAQAAAGAPSPFEAARVERLLENRLACRGCHVVAGRGGAIGPPLTGLAERAEAAYVRSVIRDPLGTIPGTLMPPQSVRDGDLDRLVRYLLGEPVSGAAATGPTADPVAPPALADATTTDGAALYARHCAACHGESGAGDGWNAPLLPVAPTPHSDPELMSARPDDSLYDAIHGGAYVLDGSPRMPPYGDMLAPAQIQALVAHIRVLCACEQPAWAGG